MVMISEELKEETREKIEMQRQNLEGFLRTISWKTTVYFILIVCGIIFTIFLVLDRDVLTTDEVMENDEKGEYGTNNSVYVRGKANRSIVGGAGRLELDGKLTIPYAMSSDPFRYKDVENGDVIIVKLKKGEYDKTNDWHLIEVYEEDEGQDYLKTSRWIKIISLVFVISLEILAVAYWIRTSRNRERSS